ncbi:ATP-dependent DNA helicase pif1, partial [Choanephora cucurbitarum]
ATFRTNYALFNSDQKYAFDTIVDKLQSTDLSNDTSLANSENAIVFFLHGPAGTGKTFVYNTLSNYLRSQRKIGLCVASSGIASLLLSGCRTSHFRLKIPIKVNETSSCYNPKNSELAELLRKTDLIIWNEVPMQNKQCFEAVDRTFKDIRSNNTLFGGLPVLLGDDFAQIPPVLMQNARIPLPQYISQTYSLNKLIYKMYPVQMLNEVLNNPSSLCNSAILTSRNDTVDAINLKVLDMMPGEAVTLISADKADYSDEESANNELYRVSNEYPQTLNLDNFSPAKLTLKVGCIVMLLRNLNPQKGFFAVVRSNMSNEEQIEFILRIKLTTLDDD